MAWRIMRQTPRLYYQNHLLRLGSKLEQAERFVQRTGGVKPFVVGLFYVTEILDRYVPRAPLFNSFKVCNV